MTKPVLHGGGGSWNSEDDELGGDSKLKSKNKPWTTNTNIEQKAYYKKPSISPYDIYLDSLMLDIPYPEMGFEEPTLAQKIKHYLPGLGKNVLSHSTTGVYKEFIDMAWDPPEYRDAKKIRINQAIREWNTPLQDEHRMKMDIINVEEPREYTFTAKDEFSFQLAKTVTNVLF